MSYIIKIRKSEITHPLPINFCNKLQDLYDNNGPSGQFLILNAQDKDDFKLVFTREAEDDFEPIQDRVNKGESLRSAVLNVLADDLLYNPPKDRIADVINDICKVLRDGTAFIEPGFVREFTKSGLVGGTENEVLPIRAEVHSDDRKVEVEFDATPWFEQASDKEIMDLAGCEWRGDYPADVVADFMHDSGHPGVTKLFDYLHILSGSRDAPGFECSVNEEDAITWLKVNRPHLNIDYLDESWTPGVGV